MKAVDALKSVLCGPDGKCCIAGSQADRDTVDTALAAIQHYLDQRKAELPEPAVTNDDLKEMESKVDYWREQHADLGLKYDNLLQAFHIAETDVKLWKGTAKKARVEALNEAKLVAKTTCHHESTEFANGFNMAALNIESAIEALKGK